MDDKKFDYEMERLFLKNKYELLEKYKELLQETKELRKFKATSRERYERMSKTLITYMDLYGSLDKKGKKNGVHKQI